jgi:gamma-glutamylcyclotransferase (GGCT)/AIG2-like uncharacterized protein YtfP
MEYLFVYGLLRKKTDHPMAIRLSEHSKYFSTGHMEGALYNVPSKSEGEYPAAVYDPNSSKVILGDVLEIDPAILDELDGFENANLGKTSEYERKKVGIKTKDKTSGILEVNCWVYLYLRSTQHLTRIESGDWFRKYDPNQIRRLD